MNRYPLSSPKLKDTFLSRFPSDEKDQFILNLQSKLKSLESNYLNFMEKFSDLLQTEELKTSAKELITEQSSSLDRLPLPGPEYQKELLSLLENIRKGKYLKQLMNEVTNLSTKTEDSLLTLFKTEKLSAEKIKNLVSSLKRFFWESLIQKEELTKTAVSACIQRLAEPDKPAIDPPVLSLLKTKLKESEEKQLKLTGENQSLLNQLNQQTEALNKIKSDYSILKKIIENSKSPSKKKDTKFRSRSSSPEKQEEDIRSLKEINKNLNIKLKIISHQNSVLKTKKRYATNSESAVEADYSQKEIQEQLNNLKSKLFGFEKIAKNLIDSGCKNEDGILKKKEARNDLSLCSPRILKQPEEEKKCLLRNLKAEKTKNEEIFKELREKNLKIRVLEDELLKVQSKLLENSGKIESVAREKEELELLVKDFEIIKQEFQAKIIEKETQVSSIELISKDYLAKIKTLEEEKKKYFRLVGQQTENQKRLEENLKKITEDYFSLQEVFEASKEQEKNQLVSSFSKKIEELEQQIKESTENEKTSLIYSKSLKEELEKSAKDHREITEKLKKTETENKKLLREELETIEKALESTQKEYKRIKSDYEGFKKNSEKIISEKDKIISSFEMKNHENFKLTGLVNDLKKNLEETEEKLLNSVIENQQLSLKISSLDNANKSQEKTIEKFEDENKETLKKVNLLNDQVRELKNSVSETTARAKTSEESNKKHLVSIEKLQEKVKQLTEKQNTDEELLNSNRILILENRETIKRQNSVIAEKESLIALLKSELDEKLSDFFKITEKHLLLESEISSSDKEKEILTCQIESLKTQVSCLEKSDSEKNLIIEEYRGSQKDLNDFEASLKENLQKESESKLKEKVTEISILSQELREKKDLIETLEQASEALKADQIKLQFDLESKEKIISSFKKQIAGIEDLNFTLKQSLNSNEETIFESNNQSKKLKSELENIKNELKETLNKSSEKTAKIEGLKHELACLTEIHRTETVKNQDILKNLESKLTETRHELKDSKLFNSELSQKVNEISKSMQKEIEKLKSKEEALNENLENLNNENIRITSLLTEAQINEKNCKKRLLAAVRIVRNFKINDFQTFKNNWLSDISSAVVQIKTQSESEKKELISLKENLLKKIDNIEREKLELEKESVSLNHLIYSMKSEAVSLNELINRMKSEAFELESRTEEGQKLLEIEKKNTEKLNNCKKKLKCLKSANKDLQSELDSLKQSDSEAERLEISRKNTENFKNELILVKNQLLSAEEELKKHLKISEGLQTEKKSLLESLSETEIQKKTDLKTIENLQTEKILINNLLSENEKQGKNYRKTIEILQSELDSLKTILSKTDQRQNTDQKTIENLKSDKNSLKKQLLDTDQELKTRIKTIETLQSEQTSLKLLLLDSENQRKTDQKKIEKLESAVSCQKQDIESYTLKILEKTRKVESLSELLDQVTNSQENFEYESQLLLKKKELHHLNLENQTLQNKLQEKAKDLESFLNSQTLLNSENDRVLEELKKSKNELKKNVEKLEEKESFIKKLESIITDLENQLKTSQKTEENPKIPEIKTLGSSQQPLAENEGQLLKPGFTNSGEKLQIPSRRHLSIQIHSSSGFLSPLMSPCGIKTPANPEHPDIPRSPISLNSISQSFISNPHGEKSEFTDELNITPCKVLKVIKVGDKKWVLCRNENGSFIWKDENALHISGADNLLEPEENIEDIRNALGEFFRGNIVSSIELMKEKLEKPDISAQFCVDDKPDFASRSFQFEILDAGLDLSDIDLKLQDSPELDLVSKELSQTRLELESKIKKIEKKKRKIWLFKDQISVFKEQIRKEGEARRELEGKIKSSLAVDLLYLKQVFTNLVSKIKSDKSLEDLIAVLYKILEFSQEDINRIQLQRGGKIKK